MTTEPEDEDPQIEPEDPYIPFRGQGKMVPKIKPPTSDKPPGPPPATPPKP